MSKIIRRILFSPVPLRTTFKHSDFFQIIPAPETFKRPSAEYGHHPVILEMSQPTSGSVTGALSYSFEMSSKPSFAEQTPVQIPDSVVHNHEANLRTVEIVALTNALTDYYFFQYGNNARQSWSISLDIASTDYSTRWGQDFYVHPAEFQTEVAEFSQVMRSENRALMFRSDTYLKVITSEELFQAYDRLPQEFRDSFLNCCQLFSKALSLENYEPSASLLFKVSVVEALVKLENPNSKPQTCSCCGQLQYKIAKQFKDFLRKYCFSLPTKHITEFYKLRSKIVHEGSLLFASHQRKPWVENQQDFNKVYASSHQEMYSNLLTKVVRTSLRHFLYEQS